MKMAWPSRSSGPISRSGNLNRTAGKVRRQRSTWIGDAMKPETPAQRFRREASECKLNAQSAMRAADREAWLKLASDWMKLAESADLNPFLERQRH